MKRFILCCFWIVSFQLFAQELPPVQNFMPGEYPGENQNWAIDQGENGIIYIANNHGLLQYNGASWTLYPSPNGTLMRSVKVISSRIYTGSYMEFGFWERDEFGSLNYTSLSRRIPSELFPEEEFWGIHPIGNFIAFQSLNRIYIYNTREESFRILEGQGRIPNAFVLNDALYFQRIGYGIYRLNEGKEELISDDALLKDEEIIALNFQEEALAIVTRNRGVFYLSSGEITPKNAQLNNFLDGKSVYSAEFMEDGSLLLGTIADGLVAVDAAGELDILLDQSRGLGNNTVLTIFQDREQNVWLGLDNGITCVNWDSPIYSYNDKNGNIGSVYEVIEHQGRLYLGTNQGLFYRKLNTQDAFALIPGTEGQVWHLSVIGDELLCGHHNGTYRIDGEKAELLENTLGAWVVTTIPGRPDLLLQGNYDGIYVLHKYQGNWQIRNKVSGFDHSSRYLAMLGDKVFVNHEYKGVFELELDEALVTVVSQKLDSSLRSEDSGLLKFEEQLYFASEQGIKTYNFENGIFEIDSLLSQPILEEGYDSGRMIGDPEKGRWWFFTRENIYGVERDNISGQTLLNPLPLSETLRSAVNGYESIRKIGSKNAYLLGTSSGYITLDLDLIGQESFEVILDKVSLEDFFHRENYNELIAQKEGEVKLAKNQNNISFSFGVPVYKKYLSAQYQYRLLGLNEQWSPWSNEAKVNFENLPHGSYEFQVRASLGERISENTASFRFSIETPWYRSVLAYVLYGLGFVLLGFLIHFLYRSYYHNKQRKLIERNQREMELTRAQNEREIVKLKNQQLQQDFKDKSNELAASTMSLIKKNELLTKVKDQLNKDQEKNDSIKSVIAIINKNLDQNDDWEFFKQAFDNADRDFLHKLKEAHPQLSHNDIRLCAYLRLNLTSKEIAPLFNISPRSVEIKRYRLRKKMNLERDENLVNYILSL